MAHFVSQLRFLQLGFLDGKYIRIDLLKRFLKVFLENSPQAVDVPTNKLNPFFLPGHTSLISVGSIYTLKLFSQQSAALLPGMRLGDPTPVVYRDRTSISEPPDHRWPADIIAEKIPGRYHQFHRVTWLSNFLSINSMGM
jgi:hypothetical protein